MPAFESDGCTGWPDSWFGVDITSCCYEHDVAYWVQDVAKHLSDGALAECVANAIGGLPGAAVGLVMLAGVTAGGWWFWRRGKRGNRPSRPTE